MKTSDKFKSTLSVSDFSPQAQRYIDPVRCRLVLFPCVSAVASPSADLLWPSAFDKMDAEVVVSADEKV